SRPVETLSMWQSMQLLSLGGGMRTLKMLGFGIVATLTLSSTVMTIPAMAVELPDVHVALGEAYPVVAEGKLEGEEVVKLETSLKEPLAAKTVSAKLTLN